MRRGIYKTNIEEKMKEVLIKEGIEFAEQFPIRCKYGYIADFAIPDKKIIIECDGEHWHLIGNSKDRKRDAVLRKLGWKVLRFRGNEIENDIHACLNKIKQEIMY